MGCSNSMNEILGFSGQIINLNFELYLDELKIKERLKEKINDNCQYEKYYLINKFWLEDCKIFFKYNEIKEYLNKINPNINYKILDENIVELKSAIYQNTNIINSISEIKNEKNLPEKIKLSSRVKNTFVFLNEGKVLFLDNDTFLIKEKNFNEMIKILKIIGKEINIINFFHKIIKSNLIIGYNNIYIIFDLFLQEKFFDIFRQ